ncbi:hypothetical protein DL765_006638 [Monosporascus sp. GIB2]|nr:hypothetical protein DL765_006638 [Monosporascus sp. GIB2]
MFRHIHIAPPAIFVAVLASGFAAAAPGRILRNLPQLHRQRNEECGFEGNPDLYGLGIRLGIYMQWISSLTVPSWDPDGRKSLVENYIIFLYALVVVMIVTTVQATPTHAVEVVLLSYIIFGGAYGIVSGQLTAEIVTKSRTYSQMHPDYPPADFVDELAKVFPIEVVCYKLAEVERLKRYRRG